MQIIPDYAAFTSLDWLVERIGELETKLGVAIEIDGGNWMYAEAAEARVAELEATLTAILAEIELSDGTVDSYDGTANPVIQKIARAAIGKDAA